MALTKSLLKACYLLTPDPELQAVGSETKIPYEEDYNFYLERLLKCSNWAIGTINFFNTGIFGSKKVEDTSTTPTVPPAPSRTWEDDFLDDLDSGEPAVQMPTSVTVLFPHRSILLFIHTRCLLTWRGRRHYTNTSYLFICTLSSFCFFDLSMDLANS